MARKLFNMPDAVCSDGGECIPRDKQLSIDMDKQRLRTHSGGRVGSSLTEEDVCVHACVCVFEGSYVWGKKKRVKMTACQTDGEEDKDSRLSFFAVAV